MSPTSNEVERLAAAHKVPVLECVEFFLERAAIREYDGGMQRDDAEREALEDARIWVQLWVRLKGGPRVQLELGGML